MAREPEQRDAGAASTAAAVASEAADGEPVSPSLRYEPEHQAAGNAGAVDGRALADAATSDSADSFDDPFDLLATANARINLEYAWPQEIRDTVHRLSSYYGCLYTPEEIEVQLLEEAVGADEATRWVESDRRVYELVRLRSTDSAALKAAVERLENRLGEEADQADAAADASYAEQVRKWEDAPPPPPASTAPAHASQAVTDLRVMFNRGPSKPIRHVSPYTIKKRADEEKAAQLASAGPVARLNAAMADRVGMHDLKEKLRDIVEVIEYDKETSNGGAPYWPPNMVFSGNSGTGKTSTASKLANVLYDMGALPGRDGKSVFVQVTFDMLPKGGVGEYVKEKVVEAEGGMILFDEIYLFKDKPSSLKTLFSLLDTYAGKVLFAVAGYPEQIGAFFASNQGLQGRFTECLRLPDLTADDLMQVVANEMKRKELSYSGPDAEAAMLELLKAQQLLNGHQVAKKLVPAVYNAYKKRMMLLFKEDRTEHDKIKRVWSVQDVNSAKASIAQSSHASSSGAACSSEAASSQPPAQKRSRPGANAPGNAARKRRVADAASTSEVNGPAAPPASAAPQAPALAPATPLAPPAAPAARTALPAPVQAQLQQVFEEGEEHEIGLRLAVQLCVSNDSIYAHLTLKPDPHKRLPEQRATAMAADDKSYTTVFNDPVYQLLQRCFPRITRPGNKVVWQTKKQFVLKGIRQRQVCSSLLVLHAYARPHALNPPFIAHVLATRPAKLPTGLITLPLCDQG